MAGLPALSERELSARRKNLAELAAAAHSGDLTRCETEIWNAYDPRVSKGAQIYNTYSDDELLDIVKSAAERLRRLPNSTDIFCVYARYLRHRFGTWADVLYASGLCEKPKTEETRSLELLRSAGDAELRGMFMLLCANELPKHIPTRKKAKAALSGLLPYFGSRENIEHAVSLLETDKNCGERANLTEECRAMLRIISEKAAELGRTPLRLEIPFDTAYGLWTKLGSWECILRRSGLHLLSGEQLNKARTEYALKTATPDNIGKELTPDMRRDLQEICTLANKLGRAPAKGELSEPVFRRINKEFGSYRAALCLMGIAPLGKKEERGISSAVKKVSRTSRPI